MMSNYRELRKEQEREETRISVLAKMYWNHGQMPSIDDRAAVCRYINEHPEIFRGAGPQ